MGDQLTMNFGFSSSWTLLCCCECYHICTILANSRDCLSMFTRSRSLLSIWLLPTCCLFQPSTTSFIVIIVATDSTNTTHNCRRPSFSSCWKPPLERSSTRCYVSSDSRCFPKAAQNLSFLWFLHVVTDAPRTDTPLSGLAVFDYRPKNNF